MQVHLLRSILLALEPEVGTLLVANANHAGILCLLLVTDWGQRGQVPGDDGIELIFWDGEDDVVERSA